MDHLSSGTKLELPSANSAFTRPKMRTEISPSATLCVNLFGSAGSSVKDTLQEETRLQQSAFQIRWTCRCDAMSKPRQPSASASQAQRNFNWRPINQTKEDVPCLLKRFALAKISVENVECHPARLMPAKNNGDRPDSPVPFRLARLEQDPSKPVETSTAPSLFNLDRSDVAMTACGEDLEIAAASTSKGDENHVRTAHTPCLTPPQSPLKKPQLRYMLRNRTRQSKLTEWYQPRKSASLSKTHPRGGFLRARPRSLLAHDSDAVRRRNNAKKALRFSAEL